MSATISLIKVDYPGLRKLVERVYAGDPDMTEKIHLLKGQPLAKQVGYTMNQVVEGTKDSTYQKYAVLLKQDGDEPKFIGYTVLVFEPEQLLYVFGIEREYRTKDILLAWLDVVQQFLPGFIGLTLRASNERAMQFFRKNGFQVRQTENHDFVLWRYEDQAQSPKSSLILTA